MGFSIGYTDKHTPDKHTPDKRTPDKPTPRQTHPRDKPTPRTNVHQGQTHPKDKRTPGTNIPQGQTHPKDKPTPGTFIQKTHPIFFSFNLFQYILSFFSFANFFGKKYGFLISVSILLISFPGTTFFFLSKLYNFPNVHIVSTCI